MKNKRSVFSGKHSIYAGGLVCLYAVVFMETTVSTSYGQFFNIGLLHRQQNMLTLGLVLILVGFYREWSANREVDRSPTTTRSIPVTAPAKEELVRVEDPDALAAMRAKRANRRSFQFRFFAACAASFLVGLPLGLIVSAILSVSLELVAGIKSAVGLPVYIGLLTLASVVGVGLASYRYARATQQLQRVLLLNAVPLLLWGLNSAIEFVSSLDVAELFQAALAAILALGLIYMREHLTEHPLASASSST